MQKSKKLQKFAALALALVFLLAACNTTATTDSPATDAKDQPAATETTEATTQAAESEGYTAGTYEATQKGHNGDIVLEVTFDETSILSVLVKSHEETAGISDGAIQNIPKEIVEKQSLAIDAVSGATVTSNAILLGVEDAVKQAGGNAEKLKATKKDDEVREEKEITTQVLVIGAGGAGLSAAASAFENGADVLVLEKQGAVGGSTALSGGGIAATGTRFQEEKGITDTKASWMELWKERQATSNEGGMYPDYEVVDRFMDEAIITTHWLVDVVGHEYGEISGFGVDPVERLHFPKVVGDLKNGVALTTNVEKYLIDNQVEILKETKATELLTDRTGAVVGAKAETKDANLTIHADKVILATGGFAKNAEMLATLVPAARDTADFSAAAAGNTGDGILMAEKVGAVLYEDPWTIGLGVGSKAPGTGALPWDWTKIYVNGEGQRFMNEQDHYAIVTNKVYEQENPWFVLDASEPNAALVEGLEKELANGEIVKADTVEELAAAMNVPAENLVKTVEDYNAGVAAGEDAMGKAKELLVAIEAAPYYAVKLYPKTMGTFGGVKTNENYEVLSADGNIIPNLYATGETANRILYNQVYMSGSAVQFALTSGRLAGAHAAASLE